MAGKNKFTTTPEIPENRKQRQKRQVSTPDSDKIVTASGIILLVAGVIFLFSFVSHLLHGHADQSILQDLGNGTVAENQQPVSNWLGKIGAWLGNLFINDFIGISAICIPFALVFGGGYLLKFNWKIKIEPTLTNIFFYSLWFSIFTGYFIYIFDLADTFDQISGGFGYAVNMAMAEWVGGFSILIILLALVLWGIFYHGFTNIDDVVMKWLGIKTTLTGAKESFVPKPTAKTTKKSVETEPAADVEIEEDELENPLFEPVPELKPFEPEGIELIHATPFEVTTPVEVLESVVPEIKDEEDYLDKDDTEDNELVKKYGLYDPTLDLGIYQYPTLDLLLDHGGEKSKVTKAELEENKTRIVTTLNHFDISIESIKAAIGPTVTLYEIVPKPGTRIAKIKNLEDDIALNLAALGIRIIAPMPGQGTIGIEVPNKNREMVSIKSVMASEKFQKANFELPIVLGKNISNEIFVTDLAKMPHLLMAGATGQGKSVGLNVILASLLYKKHPSQVKFVLVDPKKVELTIFNKIERHFLATLPNAEESIITDTKKVVYTLNSLCIEMDERYNLLKDAGSRNIKEYNHKFVNRKLNPEKGHKYLPYIVLVIDELADLMMTAGKEVEGPIARLAQLARAIGIHLIVATQRPSVNVITGLIKANFPARLSFRVTSKIDSRTILDTGGADQLVGMGDMLLSQGSDIIRLQCAFADTSEIENVCEYIGAQRGYETAYLLPEFQGDESGNSTDDGFDSSDLDSYFDDAARVVVVNQQGSASLIQRKLKLGYNRAGRIIDQLEHYKIVGTFEGSRAREVLVTSLEELEVRLKQIHG